MRDALADYNGKITIGGQTVTNLRYADDVVLIAASLEDLQELKNNIKRESEIKGLFLNAKKTKVMKVQRNPTMANNGYIIVDNEPVENVNEFIYLGALLTNNYDNTKEIRRRISIAKNATLALSYMWKTRSIS